MIRVIQLSFSLFNPLFRSEFRLRETQGETMNKTHDIAKLCNEIQEIMKIHFLLNFYKPNLKSADNLNSEIIISH